MLSRKCSSDEPSPKHRSLFQHYRPKPVIPLDRLSRLGDHDRCANRGAAMDVGGWLRRLGLEQYEAAFRENRSTTRSCPT